MSKIIKAKKGGTGTAKAKKALRKHSKAHMKMIRKMGGKATRKHRYKA